MSVVAPSSSSSQRSRLRAARALVAALLLALVVVSNPPASAAAVGLDRSTYYGGSSADHLYGVAADAGGIYVTGKTYSGNLPGVRTTLRSSNDLFVAKLSPNGARLLWSITLGGSEADKGQPW